MHNNSAFIDQYIESKIKFFFYILAITTAVSAFNNFYDFHAYKMGDWLINYQSGFIRRGFLGEMILIISKATDINIGILLVILQIGIYFGIFFYVYRLLILKKKFFAYSLILVSPFFLFFHIADYQAGFRKEILYFLSLVFLAYTSYKSKEQFIKSFYIILLIYPLLILTHEMLALFLPYFLIMFLLIEKDISRHILNIIILLSISLIAFVVAILNNTHDVAQMNDMLKVIQSNYNVQPSGILWLSNNTSDTIAYTRNIIFKDYYVVYIFLLVIVSFAFIPIMKNIKDIFKTIISRLLISITLFGTIVLMIVAIDWGRFIYIHLFSLIILTLVKNENINNGASKGFENFINLQSPLRLKFLYFAYAFLWYFPHLHPIKGFTRLFRTLEGLIAPYVKLFTHLLA